MNKKSEQHESIDESASLKRWLNAKIQQLSEEFPQAKVVAQTKGWEAFIPGFTTHYHVEARVFIVGSYDDSGKMHRALDNLGNEFAALAPGFRRVDDINGPHNPLGQHNEKQADKHLYSLSLSTDSQNPKPLAKEDKGFWDQKVLPWTKDF